MLGEIWMATSGHNPVPAADQVPCALAACPACPAGARRAGCTEEAAVPRWLFARGVLGPGSQPASAGPEKLWRVRRRFSDFGNVAVDGKY